MESTAAAHLRHDAERAFGGGTGCGDPDCGSNSARVNDYPIGAIHMGRPDESVSGPVFYIEPILRPSGIPFDVVRGEIVRRDPETRASEPIPKDELERSSFALKRTEPLDGRSEWSIAIRKAAAVPLWPHRPTSEPEGFEFSMMYELEPDLPPTGQDKPNLCPNRLRWGEVGKHAHPPIQRPHGVFSMDPWEVEGRHAVLIRGETYDGATASVALTGEAGQRWLNIACQGTALAKMKLMGYDPEDGRTTPERRQATLKMITARYCPDRPEVSFTVTGQALIWQNAARWFNLEERFDVGEVEAAWNADGVICLNTPRRHDASEEPRCSREQVAETCPALSAMRCDGFKLGLIGGEWHLPDGAEWVSSLVRRR